MKYCRRGLLWTRSSTGVQPVAADAGSTARRSVCFGLRCRVRRIASASTWNPGRHTSYSRCRGGLHVCSWTQACPNTPVQYADGNCRQDRPKHTATQPVPTLVAEKHRHQQQQRRRQQGLLQNQLRLQQPPCIVHNLVLSGKRCSLQAGSICTCHMEPRHAPPSQQPPIIAALPCRSPSCANQAAMGRQPLAQLDQAEPGSKPGAQQHRGCDRYTAGPLAPYMQQHMPEYSCCCRWAAPYWHARLGTGQWPLTRRLRR